MAHSAFTQAAAAAACATPKQIRLPAPKPNDFLIAAVVLSYVKYLILSSATRCYDPHQLRTKLNTAFRAAVEQSGVWIGARLAIFGAGNVTV